MAGALIVAIAGAVLAVALSTGWSDTASEIVSVADDRGSASTTTVPEPTTTSTATPTPEDTTTTEQQARFTELRYEANSTIGSANQFCHLKLGL